MSGSLIIPRTTKFSFKEEAAFNTAPTDAAANSVLTNGICQPRGLGINWIPNEGIVGHLGQLKPLNAGPMEDLGFDCQVQMKGSGTAGTAPEIGDLLECSFGVESVGVASTVAASPTPTTISATVAGGTIPVGALADIEYATDLYQTRRILTNATNALTWWPPTSAAPATGADVIPGVSYLLTSTASSMKSGTGFWYFENGEKAVITGNRGNPKFTLGIRQPLLVDFAFQGNAYAHSQTAIGYTWSPPYIAVSPPICIGVTLNVYIPAHIKVDTTTTSIILKQTTGNASYFEITSAAENASNPDKLIVDIGSGVWETRDIATWTYSTQTATCTALSSAPDENQDVYIQRSICVNDTISFDPGRTITRVDCMNSASGWYGSQETLRESVVEWNTYFRSYMPLWLQEQEIFTEMWAVAGTTRGNKVAICCPNVFADSFSLDLGGDFGVVNSTGKALGGAGGVTPNTEMFLTFL